MEIDLLNKCRVCLGEEEAMHYLFNEFDQGITLREILTSTTRFEIEENDGFSPYLCQNCTTTVVDFYNLITIYKENENQIRSLFNNAVKDAQETIVIKPERIENNSEENGPDDFREEEEASTTAGDDDYITIKVEESLCGSEIDEDSYEDNEDSKEGLLQEDSDHAELNQFGLTEEEAANFSLEDKTAQMQYEYQEINTYTCPECEDCFLYKKDIQEHLATRHDITTDVNYEELSEISLLKVKRVDNKTPCANKCKICNQSFQNIQEYKEHIQTHKKNVCDVCGVGFVKKSYLKDHQEIHLPDKKHVCNFCNKAFKRRTVLVKHRRIHTHPRQCICEVCGKAFNDKGTLKTHIMLLHVKERNYMCLMCGVKFPLKATLEKHVRRHQNKEREFFCTQCPLGYKDKSSLDRHIFVKHSGQNRKSTCSKCGKQYTTVSSLLKHQRVAHGDTLTEKIDELVEKN